MKLRPTHKQPLKIQNAKQNQIKIDQNMNQVYSLLNRQQQAIQSLLNKYNDQPTSNYNSRIDKLSNYSINDGLHQMYIKPRSQTIDVNNSSSSIKLKLLLGRDQKTITRQSSPNQRNKNYMPQTQRSYGNLQQKYTKNKNQSINLPIIYQKSRLAKSRSKKIRNKNQFMAQFIRDKKKMEHYLYKVYGNGEQFNTNNNDNKISLSKISSLQNKPRIKHKQKTKRKIQKQINSSLQLPQPLQQQPQLAQQNQLSQSQNQIESDDESQFQQIETKTYQKQFRTMLRGQCLQSINFLYFSRNEQMKDWTDNLLSMMQKHDKEITSLKRKSKYLWKFDEQFFSIGIFNSDQV